MKIRLASLLILAIAASASIRADHHNAYPLPEDRGTAGIQGALEKLPVYARVLYTTAHPDDESAGTLTWLARTAHVRAAIFCLTRGDGGQNVLGDEKYEALGLVRTGELWEATRIYGVELFFSTAFEFGFSKSAEETFAKWGHDASLEEMVRCIRRYRPTVLLSAFRGEAGDGHGHHQAAGILTREAYRAAGDPQRFPQHLQEPGLSLWQPQKFYETAGRGINRGSGTTAQDESLAFIPVGDYDPLLGRSPREIGAEGYGKHRSQGNGAAYAMPERSEDSYALVDSATTTAAGVQGFFGGIDTSLGAILELAGSEKDKLEFLKRDLSVVQKAGEESVRIFQPRRPSASAVEVAHGLAILKEDLRRARAAPLSRTAKEVIADAISQKLEEFQQALDAVLGIVVVARSDDTTAVPGERVLVTVSCINRGPETVELKDVILQTPRGQQLRLNIDESRSRIAGGDTATLRDAFIVSEEAPITEPFWYRNSPGDNRYLTRPTPDPFAPFGPPALAARVTYQFRDVENSLSPAVTAAAGGPLRGADFVDLQIVPALSVSIQPRLAILPLSREPQTREFQISILNNDRAGQRGVVRLAMPAGWKSEPEEAPFSLDRKGETRVVRFLLRVPAGVLAGSYPLEALVSAGGREYRRGYRVISYPENWTRHLYSSARSEVKAFDVKIAPGLTVGYVSGAGDEVPAALEQLGVKVENLSGTDLAFGDLHGFGAIITGIRAYNVNEDLRANNARLLQYVEAGGTLIVQYVRPLNRSGPTGSAFPYGPYPLSNSDEARITVEESPVELLEPQHPLFNQPNKISTADFEGWVQERGLYFMTGWDPHYLPLLSGHDPGEPARRGGMLVARFGKGFYVYTGYAWFRQLPAGVPGAYRIFANMLSLGK